MHLILLAHNHIFLNISTFTLELKSLLLAHTKMRDLNHIILDVKVL